MIKHFFTLIFLIFCSQLFSQELNTITKVTSDSIAIKWLPSNFDVFSKMIKGGVVYRVESNKVDNPQSLDYSSGKSFKVEPASIAYSKLNTQIEEEDKFSVLLSPFIDGVSDKTEKNFAFGTAVIENVINPKFQYIVGNIIVDKDFKTSNSYYYKIDVGGLKPVFLFVEANKKTSYAKISDFSLKLDKKKTVEIEWEYKSISKEAFGFKIFHAIDNTNTFNDLLPETYLPFKSNYEPADKKGTVRDEKPIEGHDNYYRVSGLDPFGVPSLNSEWKKIYVPKLVYASAEIQKIEAENEKRIITAKIHIEKEKNPQIEKITLLRSLYKDSGYKEVNSQLYTDSIIRVTLSGKLTDDHYYYKLLAFNNDDTIASLPYYFFTLDQNPPEPPTEINGVVDSAGIVSLSWKAPKDKDIKGYRVYRGNALDEDFVEQTKRLNPITAFNDTVRLDNLSSKVYYFIRAVDNNYNNSVFSDTILLIKPDTISPVSAVLSSVSVKDTMLKIKWVNSSSEDVKNNYLVRKMSSSQIDTVLVWNDTITTYFDKRVNPGRGYTYEILTYDLSGNLAASQSIYRFFEPGYRKPLKGVSAQVNKEKKGIELSWQKPNDKVYSYVIYRAKKGEKLLPLKTITNHIDFFIDKNVNINNSYTYSVKYINENGIHSLPVQVTIIYQ